MKIAFMAVSILVGFNAQAANSKKITHLVASNKHIATLNLFLSPGKAYAAVDPKKPAPKIVGTTTAKEFRKPVVQAPVSPSSGLSAASSSVATVAAPPAKPFEPGLKFKWVSVSAMDLKTIQNFQKNESDKLDYEASAWEQPTLSYQFTKTSSFGVVPQFFHTWFGNVNRPQNPTVKNGDLKQSGAFFMGDIGLFLKQKELVKVGNTTISGTLRYDLPTSEVSQASNSPGSAWGILDVSRSVGKWDFALNAWSQFYFQNYLTSTLRDTKDINLQNRMFRDFFLGNVGYNFSKKFSATLQLGTIDTISYGDDVSRGIKYSNVRYTDISVTYAFTSAFSMSLGLWEELSMRSQTKAFNVPFDTTNDAGGGQAYFATSIAI